MMVTLNQQKNKLDNFRALSKAAVAAGKAIVNIVGLNGIAGFQFHIPDEQMITLESEITDNYLENNVAVQDHIALKPVKISLRGFEGEIKYTPKSALTTATKITQTLNLVIRYAPKVVNVAKLLTKTVRGLTGRDKSSAVDNFLNMFNLYKEFQNLWSLTKAQARAFLFFEALRNSRAIFSVTTQYRRYDNMVIETIKAVQTGQTKDISDFTITFKQLNFTSSKTISTVSAERREAQISQSSSKGLIKGLKTKVEKLFAKDITKAVKSKATKADF